MLSWQAELGQGLRTESSTELSWTFMCVHFCFVRVCNIPVASLPVCTRQWATWINAGKTAKGQGAVHWSWLLLKAGVQVHITMCLLSPWSSFHFQKPWLWSNYKWWVKTLAGWRKESFFEPSLSSGLFVAWGETKATSESQVCLQTESSHLAKVSSCSIQMLESVQMSRAHCLPMFEQAERIWRFSTSTAGR